MVLGSSKSLDESDNLKFVSATAELQPLSFPVIAKETVYYLN